MNSPNSLRFHQSLHGRLLIPLAVVTLVTATVVSIISYVWSERASVSEMNRQYQAVAETLSAASFPLTPVVLDTLSQLTKTDLVALDAGGRLLHSTAVLSPALNTRFTQLALGTGVPDEFSSLDGFRFRAFRRMRTQQRFDASSLIVVVFDEQQLNERRRSTASLPLATGLTAASMLSVLVWLLSRRMVGRIHGVQATVRRIAGGDFSAAPEAVVTDELGLLSRDVDRMRGELARLWKTVQTQERDRLIHQLAASLAHELRNSLTGARMAVELHRRECDADGRDESLDVATKEIRRTEEYVARILSVAQQSHEPPQPGTVAQVVESIWPQLSTIALHGKLKLSKTLAAGAGELQVADSKLYAAGIDNLIRNAIQSGAEEVSLKIERQQQSIVASVVDDGPGPIEDSGDDLFDAFTSTKPEGLGLGLAVVRRAAERMGGHAGWTRTEGMTTFTLTVRSID